MRNPVKSHRQTEANQKRTQKVVERYYGIQDLLRTWEKENDDIQADNHDYILGLRAKERMLKNLLLHRADASIKL